MLKRLSFVQFSLLCCVFSILSKTECKSIYYHFRRDHESSSFRKLARNKWICRETCDFFRNNKMISINLHVVESSFTFSLFKDTLRTFDDFKNKQKGV